MVCLQLQPQVALMIRDTPIPSTRELSHADPERADCNRANLKPVRLLDIPELNHEGRDVTCPLCRAGFAHHFAAF
jgi:hypothetical protein